MKTCSLKIITLLIISLIFIGVTGCEDFLEENPRNFIDPAKFYENEADAYAGLIGIYGGLGNDLYSRGIHVLNQHNTEEHWPWSMTAADVGFNYTPDYGFMNQVWPELYEEIKRANSFIDALENREVNFDVSLKARMLAEAKFLRAYTYSVLAQLWGDVPFLTNSVASEADFFQSGTPTSKIYEFLIVDLKEAINVLPGKSAYSGSDISRVNREAAKVLLAKIYMIEKDWTNAKVHVDEIIASGEYALEEDVLDNWRTANKHGKESIFEVDFAKGFQPRRGNSLFQNSGPRGLKHPLTGKVVGGLWAGVSFTPAFFNSFEDGDMRKQKLFFDPSSYSAEVGRYYTSKYFDPTVMDHGRDGPVNWVVYRYADVLLMKAEIENEISLEPNSAAYDAINMVRQRANATLLNSSESLSYEEFANSVFEERQKELFFEGSSFMDLKRRGYAYTKTRVEEARFELFDYIGYEGPFDVKEHEMVLPIPQSELDANPSLKQNPGY